MYFSNYKNNVHIQNNIAGVDSKLHVSAFRTRGVPGPTSKFVAACPCPDGLVRDGTQVGE
jgi:hypothetical protein